MLFSERFSDPRLPSSPPFDTYLTFFRSLRRSLAQSGIWIDVFLIDRPLLSSPLCRNDDFYASMDAYALFQVNEETLHDLLDLMLPRHIVRSRSNLTSPWFDEECRSVKRDVRRLERHYHSSRDVSDRFSWITALREKHYLFRTKENEFWERTVNDQKSDSKKLWRTVSTVLGKSAGKSASLPFSPAEFLSFLESKVEAIIIYYSSSSSSSSV